MKPEVKLDRMDARIIEELQQDGRRTVVELGERIGLTGTPCARRLKQLEQNGVILGYTAIVVPYWEWNALTTSEEKNGYLIARLEQIVSSTKAVVALSLADGLVVL